FGGAGPAQAEGRASLGDRPEHEVGLDRAGVGAGHVQRVLRARRDRDAEPVRDRERDHHRMKLVVAIRPAAGDRECQVELGRRGAARPCGSRRITAESTFGSGSNAVRGTSSTTWTRAWYCTKAER